MAITFLFGSGADTDYCEKLKSGASFSAALLKDCYKKERKQLLAEKSSQYSLVRSNSVNVFLKTIETYQMEAMQLLDKDVVDICVDYYNSHKSELQEEVHQMCKEWYDLVTREEECEVRNFFLEKAAFFDSLDVKFNSLRNIPFNNNANRVINAYVTIFILMMYSLYTFDDDFYWSWENVFNKLEQKYDCLLNEKREKTYYQEIVDKNIDCHVVTTNYTNIAEKVLKKEDTIYLHGKLTWFEDYKNLTIYDCNKADERKHALDNQSTIFPFILIPSGVKPLICERQIEEFHRAIDVLKHSNLLCVLGYRFNSEDNHINSIIAEWLRREGKQLIYFNYNDDLYFSKIELFNNFNITKISTSNMKRMTELQNYNIIDISINKDNSVSAFAEFLENITNDGGYKNV